MALQVPLAKSLPALAAIATYALIAPDLRLSALAALISTWIFSYVGRHMPAPALASGFVLRCRLLEPRDQPCAPAEQMRVGTLREG